MAENLKFGHLCEILERISSSTKDKKQKYLHKLIKLVRENSSSLGASFFSLFRILLPNQDKERGPYGVKEHTLAKTYIRILYLPKDGQDANKLLKFRTPAAGSSAGDFADVAYWVLKSRCRNGGKLTVLDVDSHLEKIATLHAGNKPRGVDDELTYMLLNMSAEEQKWLIRVLLKDLRLGLGQTAIFNALHPDAKELYEMCNNLRKVCEQLQDPSKHLHEICISLFESCNPMRSERLDILNVDSILSKAPFYYVERKHDGERFQIHMKNGLFKYFSSSGKEYSENYGDTVSCGILTPLLAAQLHSHVQTCILDGEMMGWHKTRKCFKSHGQQFYVKSLKEGDAHRPCFCVFDVLMLNEQVLTNKPMKERTEILKTIFTPLEGVLMETPQKSVTAGVEVVKALNDAIDNQEEGLILKHPYSVYKPATRKGGWYKIKPEYTVGLTDELDVIIVGGFYGGGRRKANISHFLVGVALTPKVDGGDPSEFHSLGRIGSGYTNEELSELSEKLSPHWKSVRGAQMPHGLVWAKERPDLWIEPCNSQILQVKASEIVYSDQYKTGYTLKFPRVVKIRYDKKWSECCTTDEFEKLRESNHGKLAIRHVSSSELAQTSLVKRSRLREPLVVGNDYRAADLSDTVLRGTALTGREICVLSGNEMYSKQGLEKRIHEQGGIVVQHRGPQTCCVVVGKKDLRFKNLSEKGDVDIVTVDWLIRVLDGESLYNWKPQDLLAMSSKTRMDMEQKYDRFSDSYHNHIDEEALKMSLEKVHQEDFEINLLPSEMGDLDVELFSDINPYAVFRCCAAHFILSGKVDEVFSQELCKAMYCFQGGRVIDELDNPDLTHVIINSKDYENFNSIQNINHLRKKKFYIVTYDWVEGCWATRQQLNELDYHPKSSLYHSE